MTFTPRKTCLLAGAIVGVLWGNASVLAAPEPTRGSCKAESQDVLIEDREDRDAWNGGNEGRFGGLSSEGVTSTCKQTWYAYKPKDLDRQQLRSEYDTWKDLHFVACSDGTADIRKGGTEAVSEGTGYGMLLAVTMGDRQAFDQLLKGFVKRRNARGMMAWQFTVCGDRWTDNAATDGDLDIAMALIMADQKWGSYRGPAESLITSIKEFGTSECQGRLVLRPGDIWGGCQDPNDQRLNPSYFAPAYYRAFAQYLPNQADFWRRLVADSYQLLRVYQRQMNGLLPDWSYVDGRVVGPYGYEACRVPWRIGVDYAWHGAREAQEIQRGIFEYATQQGGPSFISDQKNSCFVGGAALTASSVSQDATDAWYRSWITLTDPNSVDAPYYQATLRVLYLLLAAGEFNYAQSGSVAQPEPSRPNTGGNRPSNVCTANSGRGYGDTWQSNGKTFAKNDPSLVDSSICEVKSNPPRPSLPYPYCTSQEGQGYGSRWQQGGFTLAKDAPDYSDASICIVK